MSVHATVAELCICDRDCRIYKAKIFLTWPFTENVWQSLLYTMVRLRGSIMIPGDVLGLKKHLRLGLRGTSEKRV